MRVDVQSEETFSFALFDTLVATDRVEREAPGTPMVALCKFRALSLQSARLRSGKVIVKFNAVANARMSVGVG